MSSFYRNYKFRMMFGIISLLSVILLIVNAATYAMIKNSTERQLGLNAQGVAVAVSLMISDNLDNYRDFLETRDVDSEYYREMQRRFALLKEDNNIKFIYTINRVDNTHTEFILDSEPVDSEFYSAPGTPETENTVTLRAFDTRRPAILPPTLSRYGVVLGSSVPIKDENGRVIGVVGVNIDSNIVFSTMKTWFIVLVAMCVLVLICISFFLSKVSDSFLEPILKDKLTGAYTKRYSDILLQRFIDRALRSRQDLFVMMLDLDHFKKINDTYGHQFGDIVLSETSAMIHKCLRKDDILIRYGGEEFLVLLFNLNSEKATSVADRIRRWVETSEIHNSEENRGIKITISIGVSSLRKRNLTGQELINNADMALYKAKETRNAVVLL